jgi:Exonuclease V - a 5' deoxyribonuclease
MIEGHPVMGVIDQIALEPEVPLEQRPMDAFVTIAKKRRLIISDVKTRVGTTVPNERNSRAAKMQVSLYHRMLSEMIDGSVDTTTLFTALGLDSGACFSDAFLVEAGMTYSATGIMDFETLLENNNLTVLPYSEEANSEIMATRTNRTLETLAQRDNENCFPIRVGSDGRNIEVSGEIWFWERRNSRSMRR